MLGDLVFPGVEILKQWFLHSLRIETYQICIVLLSYKCTSSLYCKSVAMSLCVVDYVSCEWLCRWKCVKVSLRCPPSKETELKFPSLMKALSMAACHVSTCSWVKSHRYVFLTLLYQLSIWCVTCSLYMKDTATNSNASVASACNLCLAK